LTVTPESEQGIDSPEVEIDIPDENSKADKEKSKIAQSKVRNATLESHIPIPQTQETEITDQEMFRSERMKSVPNSNSIENVIAILEKKGVMKHPLPLCCLPKIPLGRSFLYTCKRGVMQFVVIKPITVRLNSLKPRYTKLKLDF
jgi:hypothetical protein